jgi:hypothetical protein
LTGVGDERIMALGSEHPPPPREENITMRYHDSRWVCEDCYFAHHYGSNRNPDTGEWFAGESDTPADREPLRLVPGTVDLDDDVDPETGNGIYTFSSARCEGCGSNLAGSRYRLAMLDRAERR